MPPPVWVTTSFQPVKQMGTGRCEPFERFNDKMKGLLATVCRLAVVKLVSAMEDRQ